MTAKKTGAIAFWVVAAMVAVAMLAVPVSAGPNDKDDLYATGITGGKTKPILDIENRISPPANDRPIKKADPTRRLISDTTKTVEDASRYQLYIEPVYPRQARLVNKEAVVEVNITFDKKGKMKDARVVNCTTPGWGFEQAVLAASLESKLSGHGEREITVKATLKFKLQSR